MTRGQLPQRAGSLGLNGGGAAAAVPPVIDCNRRDYSTIDRDRVQPKLHPAFYTPTNYPLSHTFLLQFISRFLPIRTPASTLPLFTNTVLRCHETPYRSHRPHRRQIQVLGILVIGKMCLVRYILLISIKKRNRLRLRFSCISDLHFVTFAAYSV